MYDTVEFVICCGGEGTRNYPQTKGLPHKSFLPFGDKRLIDYALQDLIRMGAKHVTIVCSNQEVIDAFKRALATNKTVEEKLRKKGKDKIADVLASTFLPDDIDLKYVIQAEPLGTAHVLACVEPIMQGRHAVLLFPDDVVVPKDPANPLLKRMVDDFLTNPKRAMLMGVEREDVSNNAIIVNNRLIEKPKQPFNHIAGLSPIIMCKEMITFLAKQKDEKIAEVYATGKEWFYVDVINEFLDASGEKDGFTVEMFMKDPSDVLLDTGTLQLYEKCQLQALLQWSVFADENRQFVKELLGK